MARPLAMDCPQLYKGLRITLVDFILYLIPYYVDRWTRCLLSGKTHNRVEYRASLKPRRALLHT